MLQVEINYITVLVAAIVSIILGGLWYSPVLFGNQWAKLMHFDEKKMKEAKAKGMSKLYFTAFIGSLVMSYVLAHFVDYTEATTISGGMRLGFWVWLGFFATSMLSMVLWEGKPFKLYIITEVLHFLV